MNLSGNTVLITGGATGIGFALAELLSARGSEVIICGRREAKLSEARDRCPALHTRVCDVDSKTGREHLADWAAKNFPDINILINNAGIQRDIDFTKGVADLENGGDEITTNLAAPVHLTALFAPRLMAKNRAAIVNVSSGLAFNHSPTFPIYCATKAALHVLSITLRRQLEPSGVKVFELIPPMIPDTELNLEGRERRYRAGAPRPTAPTSADFALASIEGIERDEFEIRFGSTLI